MRTINLKTTPNSEVVNQAVKTLKAGGLIIYPTETVYGLGVDATNQQAVKKLLQFKSRREGKPLSIAVSDEVMAKKYVKLNQQAKNLYQQFLPGPVTVVSQGRQQVARGVESEFSTLGVRIPDYPLILEVIKSLKKPITATSANVSGKPRPYSVNTILRYTSTKQQALVDLVLDAGELPKNPPSTVIDTTLSTPIVMRGDEVSLNPNAKPNQDVALHQPSKPPLEFTTRSTAETKSLAGRLLLKHWRDLQQTGLIFALDGPLGAGKTTLTQGLAQYLDVNEPIISPTYTYMQEYDWQKKGAKGRLHHLDLWRIDDNKVLQRLEVDQLIQPYNLIVIEWWQQGAQVLRPIVEAKKAQLIEVTLEDLGDKKRKVFLSF